MLDTIKELFTIVSFFSTNTLGFIAISALVVGGFQTAVTHALKQEKMMSREDRALSFPSDKAVEVDREKKTVPWWKKPLFHGSLSTHLSSPKESQQPSSSPSPKRFL